MMIFIDERGYTLTLDELRREWQDVKDDGEHDGMTFDDYITACTGKNGTLTRKGD